MSRSISRDLFNENIVILLQQSMCLLDMLESPRQFTFIDKQFMYINNLYTSPDNPPLISLAHGDFDWLLIDIGLPVISDNRLSIITWKHVIHIMQTYGLKHRTPSTIHQIHISSDRSLVSNTSGVSDRSRGSKGEYHTANCISPGISLCSNKY